MHHFFVTEINLKEREIHITDQKLVHQFKNVLRLRHEETVVLLDNSGISYTMKIIDIQKNYITGHIVSSHTIEEPVTKLHLYQSLLKKKDKFELVLQKGTEIGVSAFTPLQTQRCEHKGKVDLSRLYTIVKEAAEQSHRGLIPEIESSRLFTDALKETKDITFICDPLGTPWRDIQQKYRSASTISIFIGPEGGFSSEEILIAKQYNAIPISFGQQILRSETAGIVIPALFLL